MWNEILNMKSSINVLYYYYLLLLGDALFSPSPVTLSDSANKFLSGLKSWFSAYVSLKKQNI